MRRSRTRLEQLDAHGFPAEALRFGVVPNVDIDLVPLDLATGVRDGVFAVVSASVAYTDARPQRQDLRVRGNDPFVRLGA